MNHRERFKAIFKNEPVDFIPIYFFGTWHETKERWKKEGLTTVTEIYTDPGPQVPGMAPDWEEGIWNCHGLVNLYPIGDIEPVLIEDCLDYTVKRTAIGEIIKETKNGTSISQTLEFPLKPTWESWKVFKQWMDVKDPKRWPEDLERKAVELNKQDRVLAFVGGSLYGFLRAWMGVENISLLMYDDPELFEAMVSFMADHYIKLMEPVLKLVKFDMVYFFEDCCGADRPLFSPTIYNNIFDKYYKKMLQFYKNNGVEIALIDSDGAVDEFVPLWIKSGFDIIFPVEVGTWKNSPKKMREKHGEALKMLGGVDKHVIPNGEEAIRTHLLEMKAEVQRGGYLPIPDHRIPPECSYNQFLVYIKVFNEVFNGQTYIY